MADPDEPRELRSQSWLSLKGVDVPSLDMGPICAVVVLLLTSAAAMTMLLKTWKEQPREQLYSRHAFLAVGRPHPQQGSMVGVQKEQQWAPPLRTVSSSETLLASR